MALIYLDHNATSPVDEAVLETMMPWLTGSFYNAASAHAGGQLARAAVEGAREQVAAFIGCRPSEVVFTSGATESNNLAIKGVLEAQVERSGFVTASTEHRAVLDAARYLEGTGHLVTVLEVGNDGRVDLGALEDTLSSGEIALVSIMAANNETGVISDLGRIGELVHAAGSLLHTDATQALGRINVDWSCIDLLSCSGHKLGGPKGVGCLIVRRGVDLEAQIHGGGHEHGLRSGTINVPAVVGIGKAFEILNDFQGEAERQRALRDDLEARLLELLPDVEVVGGGGKRLPNTSNLWFRGADAEAVMANCPTVAISAGSACTALVPTPSHVLTAMGLGAGAEECLRFSLGRQNTQAEVAAASELVVAAVRRVRELNR